MFRKKILESFTYSKKNRKNVIIEEIQHIRSYYVHDCYSMCKYFKVLKLTKISCSVSSGPLAVKLITETLACVSESSKRGRSFINCGSLSVMMVNCLQP